MKRTGRGRTVSRWALAGASVAFLYSVPLMTPLVSKLSPGFEGPLRASMPFLFPACIVWVGLIGESRLSMLAVYGAMGVVVNGIVWSLAGLVWGFGAIRPWSAWVARAIVALVLCLMLWN